MAMAIIRMELQEYIRIHWTMFMRVDMMVIQVSYTTKRIVAYTGLRKFLASVIPQCCILGFKQFKYQLAMESLDISLSVASQGDNCLLKIFSLLIFSLKKLHCPNYVIRASEKFDYMQNHGQYSANER